MKNKKEEKANLMRENKEFLRYRSENELIYKGE